MTTLLTSNIPPAPFKDLWEGVLSKVHPDVHPDSGGPAGADSLSFGSRTDEYLIAGRSDPHDSLQKPFNPQSACTPVLIMRSDVAIGDWDVLLCAVKARLRLSVSETFATPLEPHLHDQADRIRSSVLECVDALDQLHETLSDEFGRRNQR